MSWLRFLRRGGWHVERAKELEAYLQHEIDDNLARGMPHIDAIRAAHLKLGNTTRIREEIYDMNTLAYIDSLYRDLRYGVRLLVRNRTFAAVAIATLALGTGANAAIFQVMNAVRLRALPVERPEQLVSIGIDRHGQGRVGMGYGRRSLHTERLWEALAAEQQAFSSMAAWGSNEWDTAGGGEAQRVRGYYVSGNFFETLGVRPYAGRLLTRDDDHKGCGPSVAVLSYGFWHTGFGGRSDAIGQTLTLNRRAVQIVGVTPPNFFGMEVGRTFDVAAPMCVEPVFRPRPGGRQDVWWLDIVGRLKPDWTLRRAEAHLAALSPGIFSATVPPSYNAEAATAYARNTFTAAAAPTGVSHLRTEYATLFWVLFGATCLVLLITCANLANLMLARATTRDREMALRLAIGASRGRVVRQLLCESLLLAGFGAAAGILLAQWMSRAFVAYLGTQGGAIVLDLSPDWRVFAFVTIVAVLSCLVFGLSPALRAMRADPGHTLHAGGRSSTDARSAIGFRRALIVVQVALSLVLVVGAMMFGRTLFKLSTVNLGFRTENLVVANVDLRPSGSTIEAYPEMYRQMMERLRAVPGVEHASESMIVPLSQMEWNGRIVVGGVLQEDLVYFQQVGAEYFRTMDVPVLEGRGFDDRDRPGTPPRAMVNEAFARVYFPDRSPVGQAFSQESQPGAPQPSYEVVGLVRNTKYGDVRERFVPIVYLAWSQEPQPPPFMQVVLRSDVPFGAIRSHVTDALLSAAPGVSLRYTPVTDFIRDALTTERLMAALSGFFGALGMLIAAVGLYGVMSYTVTRRRIEIAIRMALGADAGAVTAMVLKESGALLAAGVLLGLPLAFAGARYAGTLLFDMSSWDPTSFTAAAAVLVAASAIAAWMPARRASRVTPTVALRE